MSSRAVWLVSAVIGLAGCGGGGGGSSDDNLGGNQGATQQFTTSDLLGTWIRTAKEYSSPAGEWIKTSRQTIIIENVAGVFRFRNCVDDSKQSATLASNRITLGSEPNLALNVTTASNMSGTVEASGTETNVTFTKVSSEAKVVLADVDLTVSMDAGVLDNSEWNQVCLETVVSNVLPDSVALKAVGTLSNVTGTAILKFETASSFEPGQYDYPGADDDINGSYNIGGVSSGTLSDPVGSTVVVTGDPLLFDVDVVMTDGSNNIGIDGQFDVDAFWLEGE